LALDVVPYRPDADAEDNPAFGDDVQSCKRVGQQDRISQRGQHGHRADPNFARLRRQRRHRGQAITSGLVQNRDAVAQPDMIKAEILRLRGVNPKLVEVPGRILLANQLTRMQQEADFHAVT